MELMKQNQNWLTKPSNKKIAILSMALLMCMSLFLFPQAVYAAEDNRHIAPPFVEAEIIGSLLRIHTASGFHAVEAVYINGRRFNHRVNSALVIDISQYIATGDTIAVHAVDFAGNHSNTVLLTPPVPAQPPAPNNLTPDGQGELLDHLTSWDMLEFITIETPTGNIFYLIIDHTRSSNNVFFLNPVTEWDLLTLAADAGLPAPPHISSPQMPTPPPVVIEHDPPAPTETPPPDTAVEPPPVEADSGGGAGRLIFLGIAGAGAFGVIYYLKIYKPKKEREMYGGGDEETAEGDAFEDVDETENAEFDADGYDVDGGKFYKDGDER